MFSAIARFLGLIQEEVHHIEDEFNDLAVRFEGAANRAASKAEALISEIASKDALLRDVEVASDKAIANAKKVRDFFAS